MRRKLHRSPACRHDLREAGPSLWIEKGLLQSDPNQVPSVACLLYLAAVQIVMRGISGTMLKATKVPCRPVWGQLIGLAARIAAATFLSLRGSRRAATGVRNDRGARPEDRGGS